MRYIVLNDKIKDEEIISRKLYIENITNLYFTIIKTDVGVEYISIPSSELDVLFVVGHNSSVMKYLNNNNVLEKYMVFVSCYFNINKNKYREKQVYVSYDSSGMTHYCDGKEYGLLFNISSAELKLINSSGNLIDRVNKYFRRII